MFQFEKPAADPVRAVRFDYVKSVVPKPFAESWIQLWSRLCIRKETRRKDQRALWSPVIYKPGTTRGNRNVDAVTCLVVDMDGESFDYARLDGLEWFAYTTWSNTPDDQHWHLVLPLKDPVPAEMWSHVWTRLHERINVVGDPATKDPARIFYLPQYPIGKFDWSNRRYGMGERLDADVAGAYIPSQGGVISSPRSAQSRPRTVLPDAANPAWWNTPSENNRYDGMTEREALEQFFNVDWPKLKKVLLSAE